MEVEIIVLVRSGEDLYIKVPKGTVIKDAISNKVIADLSQDKQIELVLSGGRGGKGNSHFATSTRQVPRFAQDGEKGIEKELILELKLLADVGLIGFPNVGKSTLLSIVTSATPKIADYHFTTLQPNLGVVKTEYGDSFVIADIPGIIEGASKGIGLGLQFLRHIERTRLLLHVVDVSGSENRNPVEDFNKVNEELQSYSKKLANRKQIIVANKIDVMQNEKNYQELEAIAKQKKIEIFKVSAATGEGIRELLKHTNEVLKNLPKEDLIEIEEKVIYELKEDKAKFEITKQGEIYVVEGPAIDRILGRTNIADNESLFYFQKCLKEYGIENALREEGIQSGDIVKFGNWEFEWYD